MEVLGGRLLPAALSRNLHTRLDETTFQKLAKDYPRHVWLTDTGRLDAEFLEQYLIPEFDKARTCVQAWQLTDAQIQKIVEINPKFAWKELRRLLEPGRKDLIPKWEEPAKTTEETAPTKTKGPIFWTILWIVVGIALRTAYDVITWLWQK